MSAQFPGRWVHFPYHRLMRMHPVVNGRFRPCANVACLRVGGPLPLPVLEMVRSADR